MVEAGKIRYWVEQVNKEYGLSDKNEASIAFFQRISPMLEYIEEKEYGICYFVCTDTWGIDYLSIIGWYILPEYRNVKMFKKVQDDIIMLANVKK